MGYYLLEHGDHMQYSNPRRNGGWLSGVVGVHTTESITDFAGVDPNAENTASFIGRRYQTQRDFGSYHSVADFDSIVPLLPPHCEAYADTTNNNHALSVSGALQAARWRELTQERANRIVTNMARAAARLCREAVGGGHLKRMPPARRITAAEAIAGSKDGFYGHGETNPGTRYDPGAHFDWDLFLAEYAKASGTNVTTASAQEEDDMPYLDWPKEDRAALAKDVNGYVRQGEKVDLSHMVKYVYDAVKRLEKLAKAATPAKFWGHLLKSTAKSSRGKLYAAGSHLSVVNGRSEDGKRERAEILARLDSTEVALRELAKAQGIDADPIVAAINDAADRAADRVGEAIEDSIGDVELTFTAKTPREEEAEVDAEIAAAVAAVPNVDEEAK